MGCSKKLKKLTLIDKKPLPLSRIAHFHRVLRHKCVEKCIVLFGNSSFFSTKNSSETLSFLTPGATVGRNLDKDVGVGQIETSICYLESNRYKTAYKS